ncbi:unnamed protein product [Larinioides sclopetarius]|uniref:Uncharacterized protein n=1 Tax=Larinioides sclopetarius TaxID=280406 RepID=A0AAV2B5G9_9ARAC
MNVLGIFQNFSITFLAPNMDFQCVEPPSYGKENDSKIPISLDDRCRVPVGPNETVPCTRWEYDTSQTSQTIVSEEKFKEQQKRK